MGMNCNVIMKPSFYKKVGANWQDIISKSLNTTCLTAERYCKEECPVDTGTLKRGHSSNLDDPLTKSIRNPVEYWAYVNYGTKNQQANPYVSRALKRVESENTTFKAFQKELRARGVK